MAENSDRLHRLCSQYANAYTEYLNFRVKVETALRNDDIDEEAYEVLLREMSKRLLFLKRLHRLVAQRREQVGKEEGDDPEYIYLY